MKKKIIVLNLIGFFWIQIAIPTSSLSMGVESPWQKKMRELSSELVDAFPFFYSKSEFRDPKNKKVIAKHLRDLRGKFHQIPVSVGKKIIGSEPLVLKAQAKVANDLKNASALFESGKIDESQKLIHKSMHKCLACHTAHQRGPIFPETNSEVYKMVTPFVVEKVVALGALRQFDGALDFIEKSAYKNIDLKSPSTDELVRLYMVISLRGENQFVKAKGFLTRLLGETNISSEQKEILNVWSSDIDQWQSALQQQGPQTFYEKIKASIEEAGENPNNFVKVLFESFLLHNGIANDSSSDLAHTYFRLGRDYQSLKLATFSDLSQTYFEACISHSKNKDLKKKCKDQENSN